MKILHLWRHAKSSRDDPGLPDHDRPLASRGQADAPRMAAHMALAGVDGGVRPDLVAVSSALRTRQTWELAATSLPAPSVRIEAGLYLCGPERLFDYILALPDDAEQVLMVGHNPDLEAVADRLAGDATAPALLNRLRDKFPTGAWAELHLGIDMWRQARTGCGVLFRLVHPRDLAI